MKVLNIYVGTPKDVTFDGKVTRTSIFKSRIDSKVMARLDNIDGDAQADLSVHGGRDKAIYVYSADYYAEWSDAAGQVLASDAPFGENLSVTGGKDDTIVIGSRYRLGNAEVTVAQPRIPCFKLGIRWNDKAFPQRFWAEGRLGFYLRVEGEGAIQAGQSMLLISQPDHGITVRDLYDTVTGGKREQAMIALDALSHLDEGWIRRLRAIGKTPA